MVLKIGPKSGPKPTQKKDLYIDKLGRFCPKRPISVEIDPKSTEIDLNLHLSHSEIAMVTFRLKDSPRSCHDELYQSVIMALYVYSLTRLRSKNDQIGQKLTSNLRSKFDRFRCIVCSKMSKTHMK